MVSGSRAATELNVWMEVWICVFKTSTTCLYLCICSLAVSMENPLHVTKAHIIAYIDSICSLAHTLMHQKGNHWNSNQDPNERFRYHELLTIRAVHKQPLKYYKYWAVANRMVNSLCNTRLPLWISMSSQRVCKLQNLWIPGRLPNHVRYR